MIPILLSLGSKHPGAKLDYTIRWASWLPTGDAIASYTAAVTSGITLVSHSQSGSDITAWLEGGTAGQSYVLTVTVTTSAGRIQPAEAQITVTDPTP